MSKSPKSIEKSHISLKFCNHASEFEKNSKIAEILQKKIFFFKIFVVFEVFFNLEAWLQNLRLVNDFSEFSRLFDSYIGPESVFLWKWEI